MARMLPWIQLFRFASLGPRLWNTLAPEDQGCAALSQAGNLRAVQVLLGHAKIETTVRNLGVEVDDALRLAEQIEL